MVKIGREYPVSWTCPRCGYRADATTGVAGTAPGDERPKTGAVSICLACAHVGEFVEVGTGMAVREFTAAQLTEVLADPDVAMVLETLALVRARTLLAGDRWPG